MWCSSRADDNSHPYVSSDMQFKFKNIRDILDGSTGLASMPNAINISLRRFHKNYDEMLGPPQQLSIVHRQTPLEFMFFCWRRLVLKRDTHFCPVGLLQPLLELPNPPNKLSYRIWRMLRSLYSRRALAQCIRTTPLCLFYAVDET